jgi:hypothetical protein
MTSSEIHVALQRDLFKPGRWAYVPEFRAGTGWSEDANRYLDAWAITLWPSEPLRVVALEIKTARNDWLRERKQPRKRDAARRICNEFYFVAPPGVILESEVPESCGLIEVGAEGLRYAVKAEWWDQVPHWLLVQALARRVTVCSKP